VTPKARALASLWAAALAVALASSARAQEEPADLGDTGAPPPSAEDLGVVPPDGDEPLPPVYPTGKKKRPEPKGEPKGEPMREPGAVVDSPRPARPAPAPAPVAPPSAEVAARAKKLKEDTHALLIAEPGDARALEALVGGGVQDALYAAEPTLRPLLKLARARSLLLQGRLDEALNALGEVRALAEPLPSRAQRRFTAEVRYRQAEIEELRTKPAVPCGPLGLKRLAALEGRAARQRMESVANRYRQVVKVGERFWSRRAAFRSAALSDDFYRRALAPPEGFRGVTLPNPFAVSRVDTKALVGDVFGGAWPAEISRLYSEVIASIDVREPDPILLGQVRERAAAFARIEVPDGESAVNPWLAEEKHGLIRFNRRFEMKTERGWTAIEAAEAKAALTTAYARGAGTIEHAYALAASADSIPAPPADVVSAAIAHADPRVQLAGLYAAEKHPNPETLDALVERAAAASRQPAFSTLQASLYGTRERALNALRTLANKDRTLAEKLLIDARLPPRERVWIVAELGEARLQYTLQSLSRDRDPVVAATALYALFLAAGKNAAGWMRATEPGVVGCVSKMLAAELPR
jgi:hypothetical protein